MNRIIPIYKGNSINISNNKLEYIYNYQDINIESISIYKEILRYKIIQKLVKIFSNFLQRLKKYTNITILFKYNRMIELVQRWCWDQYNENTIDTVIPYNIDNNYNFNNMYYDINYILRKKISDKDNIYILLEKKIKKYLKKSYDNFKRKKDRDIELKINKIIENDFITLYVMYKKREYKVKFNILLYNRLVTKLKLFNKIEENYYDNYIYCLIFRYSYIDSVNQQLAIDTTIKHIFKDNNINFELFGSAINSISDYYCSLFYDIEKYFGSRSNFFSLNIIQGIYWCNPPYIETLITNTAKKIVKTLIEEKNVAFIITIPIWDEYTQDKIKKDKLKYTNRNYNINSNSNMHTDYEGYTILKPYIKDELVIPKFRIPYYNHRLNTFIYAKDTYMLIIYNNIDKNYVKIIHDIFTRIIELDKTDFFIKK